MFRELVAGVSGVIVALIAFTLVLISYQPVLLNNGLANSKLYGPLPLTSTFAGANQHVLLPAFGTAYPGVTQALMVLTIATCLGILTAALARSRLKEL